MNRSKLIIILVSLFLVQPRVALPFDARTYILSPNQQVSPTETNPDETLLQRFNILAFALNLYSLDAHERLSKEGIQERLKDLPRLFEQKFGITFDLDNIDFKRKGFTRYYPFRVHERQFIIRIFNIQERHFLQEVEVLYEGAFEKQQVGFQVLPGIDVILEEKKIEKMTFALPIDYSTQP